MLEAVQDELKMTEPQQADVAAVLDELSAYQRQQMREELRRLRRLPEEQQIAAAGEAYRRVRDLVRQEAYRKFGDALSEQQTRRYRQIVLQRQKGPFVFTWPEVERDLQLTAKQRDEIRKISDRTLKEFQKLGRRMQGTTVGESEKLLEAIDAQRQRSRDDVLKLLTSNQRSRWRALLGKRFDLPRE